MKTFFFCRKLILGFLVILGGSLNALSQDWSCALHQPIRRPGYIISNTGDSNYGKIKAKLATKSTDWFTSQITLFGPNKEKIRYDASSIQGLGLEIIIREDISFKTIYSQWEFHECRPSPKSGVMVFMHRYEVGRIKVFYDPRSAMYENEWTYSGPINGISFTYSPDAGLSIFPTTQVTTYIKIWHSSYYIEKDGGELLKVNKKNYESIWPSLLGDCTGIIEEVNKNPKLKKFNNFLLMVRLYNQLCN